MSSPGDSAPVDPAIDEGARTLSVQSLQIGATANYDITDNSGRTLLSAGEEVTQTFIDRLRWFGLQSVRIAPPPSPSTTSAPPGAEPAAEAASPSHSPSDQWLSGNPTDVRDRIRKSSPPSLTATTRTTRQFDQLIEAGQMPFPPPRDRLPLVQQTKLSLKALRQEVDSAATCYRATIDKYSDLAEQAIRGSITNLAGAMDLVCPFLDMVRMDATLPLFVLDLKRDQDEYLFQHGLNVALLSMTVAHSMGYKRHHVLDVGLGSLFQDIGMLQVPIDIRLAPRVITEDERALIKRHPIATVDILEKADVLSQTALLVAYQAHERNDQSGYPRGRNQRFIHPLARVISVADTYAALTGSRPHRDALTPYTAMTVLLHEAHGGRLDREIVRSFLNCISLFPVGSYVELSNGTLARVLRNNGAQHTRPVVVPLNADGSETDVELDLKKLSSVQIIQALGNKNPITEVDAEQATSAA